MFPVSLNVILDPAVNVTSVLPLVLELITDVDAVPAPTVNEPSLVALASASFTFNVNVEPDEIEILPAAPLVLIF